MAFASAWTEASETTFRAAAWSNFNSCAAAFVVWGILLDHIIFRLCNCYFKNFKFLKTESPCIILLNSLTFSNKVPLYMEDCEFNVELLTGLNRSLPPFYFFNCTTKSSICCSYKEHRVQTRPMTFESGAETKGGQIPHADGSITTGRSSQTSIWAHCDTTNCILVSLQHCQLSSRNSVPHAHSIVFCTISRTAARKYTLTAVRAHCNTFDPIRVRKQSVKKLHGSGVPQLYSFIITAGYQQRAAQREAANCISVRLYACQLLTSGHVPHADAQVAEYSRLPSDDNTQALTSRLWPLNWIKGHCSASKRHSFRLPSQLPDTKELPSEVTSKQLTRLEWALIESTCLPDARSHTSMEPLSSPDSSRSASTVAARQLTRLQCPWKVRLQVLEVRSHCFTVLSQLAENKMEAAQEKIEPTSNART